MKRKFSIFPTIKLDYSDFIYRGTMDYNPAGYTYIATAKHPGKLPLGYDSYPVHINGKTERRKFYGMIRPIPHEDVLPIMLTVPTIDISIYKMRIIVNDPETDSMFLILVK